MATREHVLGQLRLELAAARDAREDRYATRLEAQIMRLSAGTPADPARETLAAGRPAARKAAKRGEVTGGPV